MTLTGAVMKVLEFFHWFVCIIMAYAAFIPNKTVKLYAYFSIIMIMVSWIIFDGCILWDIQKKIDPTFDIPNDTIGHMVGVSNETYAYVQTIMLCINFIVMGYQLNRLRESVLVLLMYFAVNGEFISKPFRKIFTQEHQPRK